MRIVFIISLLFQILVTWFSQSYAQDLNLDSLKNILKMDVHDTVKCNILNALAESDDEQWIKYNEDLNTLCSSKLNGKLKKKEVVFYKRLLATSYNNFGFQYVYEGNSNLALFYYFKGIKIQNEISELGGLAVSYNNVGSIYENLGNISAALDYYHKSLSIKEKLKNEQGIAISLNNIGNIYEKQGEEEKALIYFKKSLKLEKKLNNKSGIASSLHNLGLFYYNRKDFNEALNYYLRSLKLLQELNLESGVAYSLNNIGNVYENLKDNKKALEYYLQSLEIREKINDIKGISISLNSIAIVSNKLGDNNKAFIYAQKSLKLAQELGYPENIRNASKLLTEIYKKQGNSAKALEMYELYNLMKDSLNNEETKKQSLKQQYKYEFEKKETILKANQDKKNLIHANQTKRQKIIIIAIVIGLIVLIAFLAFVYNRYKITQKQKEIISLKEKETLKQKLLVEQKNKEILDSITYAKRIQSAILPQPKLVKEYLKESFILYKPKDIVAGDFYWFEVIDNLIFFAAADCTGHGVPGAMVSVVCHNALNRSVKEFNIKNPAEILNKTREIVVSEFEKSDENVKDGMDISLCVLNINSMELHWAGAHNPLWIIRKNKENSVDTCELIELKADKQPIGKFAYSKPFTDHTIKLQKEDIIYIFTDGFQDQFGGEKGKKYKISQIRELLLSVSNENLEEQKNIINQNFETWKGELDQVDDVCLMGVKI